MTPNKEKELTKRLKTLDKDKIIEMLFEYIKALELAGERLEEIDIAMCCFKKNRKKKKYYIDYFIEQARESLKDDK